MNIQYPLTVYYDASCSLCSAEIDNIHMADAEQRIRLVDCSAADFDDSPFLADGITREAMMECMHVRDNQGVWVKGVSSFELLYRTVGMTTIAKFWGGKRTRPLTEWAYPWVARHRMALSWTGLPLFFKLWGKCAARRAHQRSRSCINGKCST